MSLLKFSLCSNIGYDKGPFYKLAALYISDPARTLLRYPRILQLGLCLNSNLAKRDLNKVGAWVRSTQAPYPDPKAGKDCLSVGLGTFFFRKKVPNPTKDLGKIRAKVRATARKGRLRNRLGNALPFNSLSDTTKAALYIGRGAGPRFLADSLPSRISFNFLNHCFDKGRIKNFVLWFLINYGENKTVQLLEELKKIGFEFATKAGISLGIDDLKIPPKKSVLLLEAEKYTINNMVQSRGDITGVERFQRLIDTWHRTSELLKQEVINHFESTDLLNPVYMMAFSGARGNISQVRQLVGMRGLMADPQGQILDFPIRSNFREGLTLTEYIISCYGARKGIVDTALRTANAGYLTRRLVDVAQHVIVSHFDCGTRYGILLTDIKEGNKTLVSLQNRLLGRILARDILTPSTTQINRAVAHTSIYMPDRKLKSRSVLGKAEHIDRSAGDDPRRRANKVIAYRNQEISIDLAFQISQVTKKVFVRSPLTCETKKLVCQLCYGWSLAQGNLVSIGEAVGIVAGQSIGEPGTQLTMRTFHTGGVFSGDVTDQIKAPFNGYIFYNHAIPGNLIRTLDGKIAFLTKTEGRFELLSFNRFSNSAPLSKVELEVLRGPSNEKSLDASFFKEPSNFLVSNKKLKNYKIPPYTLLYVRNGDQVIEKEVVAQISTISQNKNIAITDEAELVLKSELEGEFMTENLIVKYYSSFLDIELLNIASSDFIQKAWDWGYAWILSGKIYQLFIPSYFLPKSGDIIHKGTLMNETFWSLKNASFHKKSSLLFNDQLLGTRSASHIPRADRATSAYPHLLSHNNFLTRRKSDYSCPELKKASPSPSAAKPHLKRKVQSAPNMFRGKGLKGQSKIKQGIKGISRSILSLNLSKISFEKIGYILKLTDNRRSRGWDLSRFVTNETASLISQKDFILSLSGMQSAPRLSDYTEVSPNYKSGPFIMGRNRPYKSVRSTPSQKVNFKTNEFNNLRYETLPNRWIPSFNYFLAWVPSKTQTKSGGLITIQNLFTLSSLSDSSLNSFCGGPLGRGLAKALSNPALLSSYARRVNGLKTRFILPESVNLRRRRIDLLSDTTKASLDRGLFSEEKSPLSRDNALCAFPLGNKYTKNTTFIKSFFINSNIIRGKVKQFYNYKKLAVNYDSYKRVRLNLNLDERVVETPLGSPFEGDHNNINLKNFNHFHFLKEKYLSFFYLPLLLTKSFINTDLQVLLFIPKLNNNKKVIHHRSIYRRSLVDLRKDIVLNNRTKAFVCFAFLAGYDLFSIKKFVSFFKKSFFYITKDSYKKGGCKARWQSYSQGIARDLTNGPDKKALSLGRKDHKRARPKDLSSVASTALHNATPIRSTLKVRSTPFTMSQVLEPGREIYRQRPSDVGLQSKHISSLPDQHYSNIAKQDLNLVTALVKPIFNPKDFEQRLSVLDPLKPRVGYFFPEEKSTQFFCETKKQSPKGPHKKIFSIYFNKNKYNRFLWVPRLFLKGQFILNQMSAQNLLYIDRPFFLPKGAHSATGLNVKVSTGSPSRAYRLSDLDAKQPIANIWNDKARVREGRVVQGFALHDQSNSNLAKRDSNYRAATKDKRIKSSFFLVNRQGIINSKDSSYKSFVLTSFGSNIGFFIPGIGARLGLGRDPYISTISNPKTIYWHLDYPTVYPSPTSSKARALGWDFMSLPSPTLLRRAKAQIKVGLTKSWYNFNAFQNFSFYLKTKLNSFIRKKNKSSLIYFSGRVKLALNHQTRSGTQYSNIALHPRQINRVCSEPPISIYRAASLGWDFMSLPSSIGKRSKSTKAWTRTKTPQGYFSSKIGPAQRAKFYILPQSGRDLNIPSLWVGLGAQHPNLPCLWQGKALPKAQAKAQMGKMKTKARRDRPMKHYNALSLLNYKPKLIPGRDHNKENILKQGWVFSPFLNRLLKQSIFAHQFALYKNNTFVSPGKSLNFICIDSNNVLRHKQLNILSSFCKDIIFDNHNIYVDSFYDSFDYYQLFKLSKKINLAIASHKEPFLNLDRGQELWPSPNLASMGGIVQGKALHDQPYSNLAKRELNLGPIRPYGVRTNARKESVNSRPGQGVDKLYPALQGKGPKVITPNNKGLNKKIFFATKTVINKKSRFMPFSKLTQFTPFFYLSPIKKENKFYIIFQKSKECNIPDKNTFKNDIFVSFNQNITLASVNSASRSIIYIKPYKTYSFLLFYRSGNKNKQEKTLDKLQSIGLSYLDFDLLQNSTIFQKLANSKILKAVTNLGGTTTLRALARREGTQNIFRSLPLRGALASSGQGLAVRAESWIDRQYIERQRGKALPSPLDNPKGNSTKDLIRRVGLGAQHPSIPYPKGETLGPSPFELTSIKARIKIQKPFLLSKKSFNFSSFLIYFSNFNIGDTITKYPMGLNFLPKIKSNITYSNKITTLFLSDKIKIFYFYNKSQRFSHLFPALFLYSIKPLNLIMTSTGNKMERFTRGKEAFVDSLSDTTKADLDIGRSKYRRFRADFTSFPSRTLLNSFNRNILLFSTLQVEQPSFEFSIIQEFNFLGNISNKKDLLIKPKVKKPAFAKVRKVNSCPLGNEATLFKSRRVEFGPDLGQGKALPQVGLGTFFRRKKVPNFFVKQKNDLPYLNLAKRDLNKVGRARQSLAQPNPAKQGWGCTESVQHPYSNGLSYPIINNIRISQKSSLAGEFLIKRKYNWNISDLLSNFLAGQRQESCETLSKNREDSILNYSIDRATSVSAIDDPSQTSIPYPAGRPEGSQRRKSITRTLLLDSSKSTRCLILTKKDLFSYYLPTLDTCLGLGKALPNPSVAKARASQIRINVSKAKNKAEALLLTRSHTYRERAGRFGPLDKFALHRYPCGPEGRNLSQIITGSTKDPNNLKSKPALVRATRNVHNNSVNDLSLYSINDQISNNVVIKGGFPDQLNKVQLGEFLVYGDILPLYKEDRQRSLDIDIGQCIERRPSEEGLGQALVKPLPYFNPNEVKIRQGFESTRTSAGYGVATNNLDRVQEKIAVKLSGQIIHINAKKITLRKGQPILISPKAILHSTHGDFVTAKKPVITLSYQKLKTGDIVQGIPKVEQFFEARTTKRGRLFLQSVPNLLTSIFKRYSKKYPNKLQFAVRQSFYKIQQILVDGVMRVYRSQGVSLADKHLEVIVKQMTTKVRILEGGRTGFFPGEIVDLDFVNSLRLKANLSDNKRVVTQQSKGAKLPNTVLHGSKSIAPFGKLGKHRNLKKGQSLLSKGIQKQALLVPIIKLEPIVLGITRASLEVDSFLSAASFQQTTKVLSKAAISKKKDFLKGLKENVLLGNLIPAGTGYLVYLNKDLPSTNDLYS